MLASRIRGLLAVTLLFWGGLGLWFFLQNSARNANAALSVYSPARLAADRAFMAENWELAAARFGEVTQADPWNTIAWRYRGQALLNQILALRDSGRSVALFGGPQEESGAAEREELFAAARTAFENSARDPEMRADARYQLARLACEHGDLDEALDRLEALLRDHQYRNQDVRLHFRALADNPRFRLIVERYLRNE